METATNKSESTREGMNSELDGIKTSFSQLRNDVVELFSHAFGLGRSGIDTAKEGATDAVENLKSRLTDLRERGMDQVQTVRGKIEENPMPAALIAFGVGFVLAKLMSRK
jgi:ElaB/YqjD/DUF883 family membrane-anchored ribosome-binding protein